MVSRTSPPRRWGNYQTLINDVLRQYIQKRCEPLEETLRRLLREELERMGK